MSPVENSVIDTTVEMRTLISQKSVVEMNKCSNEIYNDIHKLISENT